MLKNLLLPIIIYQLKVKMHSVESRIKKMESLTYLNLKSRKDLAQMKKMVAELHEQETALHFTLSM